MSLISKAKEMLGKHSEKVQQGVDKAADTVDEKTGGKYSDKIDKAKDKARDYTEGSGQQDDEDNRDKNG